MRGVSRSRTATVSPTRSRSTSSGRLLLTSAGRAGEGGGVVVSGGTASSPTQTGTGGCRSPRPRTGPGVPRGRHREPGSPPGPGCRVGERADLRTSGRRGGKRLRTPGPSASGGSPPVPTRTPRPASHPRRSPGQGRGVGGVTGPSTSFSSVTAPGPTATSGPRATRGGGSRPGRRPGADHATNLRHRPAATRRSCVTSAGDGRTTPGAPTSGTSRGTPTATSGRRTGATTGATGPSTTAGLRPTRT